MVLAGAALIVLQVPAHSSLSVAAADKSPAIVVAPTGRDATCIRGKRPKPCASFSKAYSLARCGDVIEVKAGSYREQEIVETTTGSACSRNPITIRGAPGVSPKVALIQFGTGNRNCGPCSTDAPDNLTIRRLTVTGGVVLTGDATNVILDRIDGGSFMIEGARNVTVRNSDWGPCDAPGGPCYGISGFYEGQNRIAECHGCATTTNNILIENNVVHDYTISPRSGAHSECFWINGGGNVTFRGNRIYNCTTTAWSIGEHSRQLLTGTWVIEGNWIGKTHNASSLNLTQYPYTGRMIVRSNSFGPNSTLGTEEGGTDTGTISAYRNIFGRWDDWCIPGATYRDNLFVDDYGGERGRLCGGKGDRLAVFGYVYKGVRLVADRPAADAVRSAFALVADGKAKSPQLVARSLVRLRKKAPSGGWTAATVRAIVSDRVYLGRRLGIPARHVALVKPKVWKRAQRVLAATPR